MKKHFTEEDIGMADKHMKRCPVSLATRENANLNHHEIPLIRMAKIKKVRTTNSGGCRECRLVIHCS